MSIYFYLVRGFDRSNGESFSPDPELHQTQKEAEDWIERNKTPSLWYNSRPVRLAGKVGNNDKS